MAAGKATSLELTMLAEARSEIGAADHKASMVLAALGVGFGALAGGLIARDWEPSELESSGQGFWWVGAVFALASIALAASAVWPRYDPSDVADGIFYWGHVASFDDLAKFSAHMSSDPPDGEARTLHQLWHLSRIVSKKYRRVRGAMTMSGISAVLFLLASAFGG